VAALRAGAPWNGHPLPEMRREHAAEIISDFDALVAALRDSTMPAPPWLRSDVERREEAQRLLRRLVQP